MTPAAAPAFNQVILATEEGIEHLPNPVMPYYALFGDAMFMHRSTEIGRALVPYNKIPDSLPKSGFPNGFFTFTADPVPARICAQAVDFFRRIYNKHKTEAEVLITRNYTTGEYRLFIPHQRVNGTGVTSIFEPTNIARGWMVVGTMHSHCMFGAFHSGTDKADAAKMDGLHFTIGMVLHEQPEIVAMVAMNGTMYDYNGDGLPLVADFSDLSAATAPEWWDHFVYPAGTQADLKLSKFPSLTQTDLDKFSGVITAHTPTTSTTGSTGGIIRFSETTRATGRTLQDNWDERAWSNLDWDDDEAILNYYMSMGYMPAGPVINKGPADETGTELRPKPTWGPDGELIIDAGTLQGFNSGDELPDGLVDKMIESDLLTDDDWWNQDGDIEHWKARFLGKLAAAATVLREMGLTVKFTVKDERIKVLPGQLEAFNADGAPTSEKGKTH